jgi:hypothetical protein
MSNAPQDARCLEFAEYVLENYIEDGAPVKPKTGISEIVQTKVEVSLALLLKEEHLHSTIS